MSAPTAPFGRDVIESIIPHRDPFLFLDEVLELEPGVRVVARKAVTGDEWFFAGHFPGRPIMPGVLILEAMAQAAGVMVFSAMDRPQMEHSLYYYVGIDNARFKKPVVPGDVLELEVSLERSLRGIGKFNCVARVDGQTVAEATIMCTVRPVDHR